MALIPFPNVPQLPGVPQLNRSLQFPAGPPPVLGDVIALGRLLQSIFAKPVWGIYAQPPLTAPKDPNADPNALEEVEIRDKPQLLVKPDSIINFNYKHEWTVSDYPIADGSFASFNKVDTPFEIQLRLSKGGSLAERTAFVASIEAIAGTLDFYRIITPEKTYFNCNITRYEVARRGAPGAYWLSEVDLFFRDVRVVYPEYSTTGADTAHAKAAGALPVENTGLVSGLQAPKSIVSKVTGRAAELARGLVGR